MLFIISNTYNMGQIFFCVLLLSDLICSTFCPIHILVINNKKTLQDFCKWWLLKRNSCSVFRILTISDPKFASNCTVKFLSLLPTPGKISGQRKIRRIRLLLVEILVAYLHSYTSQEVLLYYFYNHFQSWFNTFNFHKRIFSRKNIYNDLSIFYISPKLFKKSCQFSWPEIFMSFSFSQLCSGFRLSGWKIA